MTNLKAFIEEIQQRITLSSVVREGVSLTKKGREYQGLCPFHNEKTPSFYVNDEKGFYHCFGCGAHGDTIGFMEAFYKLSFMEALQTLAQKCGLQVPKNLDTKTSSAPPNHAYERLHKCLYEAAAFYYRKLTQDTQSKAWHYVMSRGLSMDDIRNFGLGFAPAGPELEQHLKSKGFDNADLIDAGLLVDIEEERRTYLRFRDRLMFPIWDRKNQIIAFGGRSLGQDMPKYMNSPETLVFHKGKTLYGLNRALKTRNLQHGFFVCEGYMDVIRMHKVGLTQTVAPLGTAIAEEQFLLLWKYASQITLCFDGDSAGRLAAKRAVERALPYIGPERQVSILLLPQGEDPDSFLQNQGLSAFQQLKAFPMSQYMWEVATQDQSFATPETKVKIKNELLSLSAKIQDAQTRKAYEEFFLTQMRQQNAPSLQSSRKTSFTANQSHTVPQVLFDHMSVLTQVLLKALITRPKILNEVLESLYDMELNDTHACEIRDLLIQSASEDIPAAQVASYVLQALSSEAKNWLESPQSQIHMGQFEKEQAQSAYVRTWKDMLANLQTLKNLEEDLKLAYKDLHNSMSSEAWERLKALQESVIALRQAKSFDI